MTKSRRQKLSDELRSWILPSTSNIIIQGDVDPNEIHRCLLRIRERQLVPFIPWGPATIQIALARRSPYIQTSHRVSGVMLANHTGITSVFKRMLDQFDRLFKRNAFLEQYKKFENILGEFDDARATCDELQKEYKASLETSTKIMIAQWSCMHYRMMCCDVDVGTRAMGKLKSCSLYRQCRNFNLILGLKIDLSHIDMPPSISRRFNEYLAAQPKLDADPAIRLATQDKTYDVFIAGSGPIGATYAKKLVDAGFTVLMVEMGSADSFVSAGVDDIQVPGAHKKNEIIYQKNIDRFVNVIQGALNTVSIPTSNLAIPTLDPNVFQNTKDKPFISLGKNPKQSPFDNLGAEAVTHCVGGMTTHWTCATPELHPTIERPKLDNDSSKDQQLWDRLYPEARSLIGCFQGEGKPFEKNRVFKPLPLACHRMSNPDYVDWHSASNILQDIYVHPEKKKLFTLLTNHLCVRLAVDTSSKPGSVKIALAEVKNLLKVASGSSFQESTMYFKAKVYVIATGAVKTLRRVLLSILYNSGFNSPKTPSYVQIPNLGKYMTEQPMAFCQVMLKDQLIRNVPTNPYKLPWWDGKVDRHARTYPNDPIPIPFRDPEPQVTSPLSADYPWHTQIHRDAFSYGAVAETIDTRLIVDFRFFGYVEPRAVNYIEFESDIQDPYDMPQPTFHFQMSSDDRGRAHRMMKDMCDVALELGGYLPGSEPQFMTPGLALHLAGTVRAGLDQNTTVADTNCKIWNFNNLYVGGNGVIPTGFGANPTLTSICYAIKSSEAIIAQLGGGSGGDKTPVIQDGTYRLANYDSGLYWDISSSTSGTNITVQDGDDTDAPTSQKWTLKFDKNSGLSTFTSVYASNLYAGFSGSALQGSALVGTTTSAKFTIEKSGNAYTVKENNSGLFLTVTDDEKPCNVMLTGTSSAQTQWNFYTV
ncbi:Pyranose 2-oxidase [Grifola frondosa]|uniref:Pyranose 2-oxidase n=1 Tax=Grifola frondosa TaxID=5627 RepID=A0A1C7LNZ9_GRIFR|nr:Pyranose 2-oxidase [Grifola frondosa]